MEVESQLLGQFKYTHGWNRGLRKDGEVHVAARTGSPLRLRTEAIQGDESWDSLANVFTQRCVIHFTPGRLTGSGYWLILVLSI